MHRIAMAALLFAGVAAPDDQPVIEWIGASAVRLTTPEAGHGFTDLQPLKKIIGNARVVALGDATYGTRAVFQLKHRMLEFLATEMGFTIFSIQANMPEAHRLNDFVLTGAGDPAKLLRGMNVRAWNTQEVLDMIVWMREFNKSGKGRVEFTGFGTGNIRVAIETVHDFVTRNHPAYSAKLRQASEQAGAASLAEGPSFGVSTAFLPVEDVAGKRAHFSGYIKTAAVNRGRAGLWWRVDDASAMALDDKGDAGASGTKDWTRYELDFLVPSGARRISFGAIHSGDGTAWFDSVAIEVDGVAYRKSPGFQTSGSGVLVQPDSQVSRSGKQSLKMSKTPDAPGYVDPDYVFGAVRPPADPNPAVTSWTEVVERLESSRQSYRVQMVTDREIERVIQNARFVLQCMQILSKKVGVGSAMAQNVEWILDRSPDAKIVLWGHNAHVASGGFGPESMGVALRKMLGDKLVVFGFNQGGPSAPPGSLEATLTAAGIPLFAIDWRQAPKSGPVAVWLAEPHKVLESFDAMFFVEKTTAARKIPER